MISLRWALRIPVFRCANSQLADDDRLHRPVSFGVLRIVAYWKPKDPAGHVQSLSHFSENGEMAIQKRRLAQGDVERAGRGVQLFSVAGADGAHVVLLLAEFGLQPIAETANSQIARTQRTAAFEHFHFDFRLLRGLGVYG